jgi:uncharacterized protein YdhG (YjbR/CyaY superfamily)
MAAAPEAEECITYRIPAFRLDGKPLVGFGAASNHCAFYPMSSTTVENHKEAVSADRPGAHCQSRRPVC